MHQTLPLSCSNTGLDTLEFMHLEMAYKAATPWQQHRGVETGHASMGESDWAAYLGNKGKHGSQVWSVGKGVGRA